MRFKVSPNWDCVKTLDQIIRDAKFAFTHKGHKGYRPMIVLNTPIDGEINCVEIDYDRYGLIVNGETIFNSNWGELITDSTVDVVTFIGAFLVESKAAEHIEPPPHATVNH